MRKSATTQLATALIDAAVEARRYLADQTAVRAPVLDDVEQLLDEERERVLATVMFTDIAGSTKRAHELGDRRWGNLLRAHDLSVRRQVAAYGGRVLKSLGDGYLATFDGPARAIRAGCAVGREAEALKL